MSKSKILFSIIMPVYNVEEYLKESINSILKQTYDNFELIIINDGSTDNSDKIIRNINDNRIIYINRDNKGALYTRIEGIKKAKGDYIIFIDSDDWLPDNTLSIYNDILKENKYDIIRGNYLKNKNGKIKIQKDFKTNRIIKKENLENECILKMAKTDIFNSLWRQTIKKSIINTSNINTNIFMGDDMELNFQIYQNSNNIKTIKNPLYIYRINQTSITNIKDINKIKKNTEDILCVLEKIIRKVKDKYSKKVITEWYKRYIRQINRCCYRLIKYGDQDDEYIKELFNNRQIKEIRKKIKVKDLLSIEFPFLILIYKNNLKTYIKIMKLFTKII